MFIKNLKQKIGLITLRVIRVMRMWIMKMQNTILVTSLLAVPTQALQMWKGLSSVHKDVVCSFTSQKKPDIGLWASTTVPCFKQLISENSELQPRLDEEIGPGRLSDFLNHTCSWWQSQDNNEGLWISLSPVNFFRYSIGNSFLYLSIHS